MGDLVYMFKTGYQAFFNFLPPLPESVTFPWASAAALPLVQEYRIQGTGSIRAPISL